MVFPTQASVGLEWGTWRFSLLPDSCQSVAGTALHGEGAGGERFLEQRVDLGAEAGFAVGEQAESFNRGAANDVGWIVVERHEQAGGAQSLRARARDAGDDESKVGAGAPVVTCLFRPDLAEESKQAVGVWGEEFGLLFSDTAGGVCSVVA